MENDVRQEFEMVVSGAMVLPGVRIDRKTFLEKEFLNYFSKDAVKNVIKTIPAQGGIGLKIIDDITKWHINSETNILHTEEKS